MRDNGHAVLRRALHRAAEKGGIDDRSAVVGQSDRSRFLQFRKIGRLLALKSFCDARGDIDARFRVLRFFAHIAHDLAAVNRRIGIRHGEQACDSACRGRTAACDYVLFLGLSGIAKVNVHVYESRYRAEAFGIDDLSVGGEVFADLGYDPVFDLYVANAV